MTAAETSGPSRAGLRLACLAVPLLALATFLLAAPAGAQATAPAKLWTSPLDGVPGSEAGRLHGPRGIGVNPSNGHVFVADDGNARIDELSAWGVFVKAFGWGVRDGAEEAQTCGPGANPPSPCQQGIPGSGAGQLFEPLGVAVDGAGDVYVDEPGDFYGQPANFRVQKFNSAGEFLLTFGGGVITGGAAGSGDLSAGSKTVTSVTTTAKAFEAGQTITGAGIPPETRITDVGVGTLTLSKAATASGSGVSLSVAEGAGNVPTNERQRIALAGSPTGGAFSLTLPAGATGGTVSVGSNHVTATTTAASGSFHVGDATNVTSARGKGDLAEGSKTVTGLATASGSFQAGQPIKGEGIPAGATIAALGPGTLTLSEAASESGEEVSLTAFTKIAAIDAEDGSLTLSANASSSVPNGQVEATETTASLPFNAAATEAQEALEALPAIGAAGASVSGPPGGPFTVEFEGALLGDTNVPQLRADSSPLRGPQTVTLRNVTGGKLSLLFKGQTTGAIGKGDHTLGSNVVTNVTTTSGALAIGQLISFNGELHTIAALGPGPGTLTLDAPSKTTGSGTQFEAFDLASNATAAAVQAALEGLSTVGSGNVSVSGPAGGPWQVSFTGALATAKQPLLSIAGQGGLQRGPDSRLEVANPTAVPSTLAQGGGAAEICTAAHAADCRGGLPEGTEAEPGQFRDAHPTESAATANGGGASASGNKIAIGPNGDLFVGDREGIEEFEADGTPLAEVPIPTTPYEEETVQSLAIDAEGNLYAGLWGEQAAFKLSPTGSLLHRYAVERFENTRAPEALAASAAGELYAAQPRRSGSNSATIDSRVIEFDAGGGLLIPDKEEEEGEKERGEPPFGQLPPVGPGESIIPVGLATSSACGIQGDDLYVSFAGTQFAQLRAYGPPPQDITPPCEAPPKVPPTIADSYALSAGTDNAVVQARINPHFWPDTTYQVQYGTGKCSEGGCTQTAPASPATLVNRILDEAVRSGGVSLAGLAPDTTYHYRFVAQSGGGGPVLGPEASFTTGQEPLPAKIDCPNQAFRGGPSATLPDCRADEMVSPIDKNGADVVALSNLSGQPTAFDQSATEGGKLTYSAYRAFGDATSAPYTVQYLATRHERGSEGEGWSNHAISPSRGTSLLELGRSVDTEFRAFSPDLCESWLVHDSDPPLAPGAIAGYPNVYRRTDCGAAADSYEALSTAEPPATQPGTYILDPQGVSADGSHAVFRAAAKLSANADAGTNEQCYESLGEGEPLRLVSVLPDGSASEADCSLGTVNGAKAATPIRSAQVSHAISANGQRIYWTARSGDGTGQIYLRNEGKDPTAKVSGVLADEPAAHFLAASADGSRALFIVEEQKSPLNGNLYEYSAAKAKATLIAKHAIGLLGASEDATRLYFVSTEALAAGAVEGEPDLYFREAGKALRFIAVLSGADARAQCSFCITPIASELVKHAASVSPDGLHAAFMSSAQLQAGFDNTDAQSGEPDAEVYLYDAGASVGARALLCASCNATGARPGGRELLYDHKQSGLWAAAQLPLASTQIYAPRVLSADGSRLFFESYEPLVLRDTNAKQDVYEWERSESTEECEEDGAELYVAADGGCLSLVSSGQSSQDSELIDTSADGSDAFFTTGSSLLPQDPGLIDVYDARTEGGFPAPAGIAPECEGAACQSPAEAPNDPTPASSSFEGAGNVKEEAPKPRKKKRHGHKRHRNTAKNGRSHR